VNDGRIAAGDRSRAEGLAITGDTLSQTTRRIIAGASAAAIHRLRRRQRAVAICLGIVVFALALGAALLIGLDRSVGAWCILPVIAIAQLAVWRERLETEIDIMQMALRPAVVGDIDERP
jgi:hypothetical protein